jgi:hypothetical protein
LGKASGCSVEAVGDGVAGQDADADVGVGVLGQGAGDVGAHGVGDQVGEPA